MIELLWVAALIPVGAASLVYLAVTAWKDRHRP